MSIQYTGTGGLFTRIGRMAKLMATVNANQTGSVLSDIDLIADEFRR